MFERAARGPAHFQHEIEVGLAYGSLAAHKDARLALAVYLQREHERARVCGLLDAVGAMDVFAGKRDLHVRRGKTAEPAERHRCAQRFAEIRYYRKQNSSFPPIGYARIANPGRLLWHAGIQTSKLARPLTWWSSQQRDTSKFGECCAQKPQCSCFLWIAALRSESQRCI